ncbi:hypothetical protein AcV5_001098 [Taiwanofungus camphoratus]|nr:hypothetical protein AcV5_001098 [Antrodia cinnamomea]
MSGPQSNAPAAMERDINTPSNAGPMATDRCPSERLAQLESAFLTRRCSLESASVARASGRFTDTNGHLFRTAYGMCMRRLRLESVQESRKSQSAAWPRLGPLTLEALL